jgi:hypothetical protein
MQSGERTMSANEYREFAAECRGWAKTDRSEKERDTFLEMANTWLRAAAMAESGNSGVPKPLSAN